MSTEICAIYEPISEAEDFMVGGPWCFSFEKDKAYLAFTDKTLAQSFIFRCNSKQSDYKTLVVPADKIGREYQELADGIDYFLLISCQEDIDRLMSDIDRFPYQQYLVPRNKGCVN